MTDTPEAREVEALAMVLYEADRARHEPHWASALDHHREPFRHMARATIDWLTQRDAALVARAKAEALREAADEFPGLSSLGASVPTWLRARAEGATS